MGTYYIEIVDAFIPLIIAVLAIGLVVALLLTRSNAKLPSRPAGKVLSNGQEKMLEQKLLSITLGNKGAVERGVTAKRRKYPNASRGQLLEMVYDDYVNDRSR